MVQFIDGSVKAQMGLPDMRLPIQYALSYPDRWPSTFGRIDFKNQQPLTFEAPDLEKFRCLALAYEALGINEQKEIENQIQMVQEGVIPEKLKKKINVKNTDEKSQLIDLTNLNMVYKNDATKINDILNHYQVQIPEQIAEMDILVKDRNYKSLKIIAKSLKTKLNYLGIKQMYDAVDSIIKLIDEDKNLTAIPGLFKPMKSIWDSAGAELADILNKKA